MNSFDKMFDFDDDGRLDSIERAVQYQFLDEDDDSRDDDPDRYDTEEE